MPRILSLEVDISHKVSYNWRMSKKNMTKLSTDPYKGVRDFYPEDMAIENHIWNVMRTTVERYGYEEYAASILEPSELYYAKSGEELVNEQTYTFKDRGNREVTLRPEMTPTVARLVAAKRRELAFPLRWYSIPNVFRYERPQRGRLREHWQLNVDLFGADILEADAEIITIAHNILQNYGLAKTHYAIRLSYAGILKETLEKEYALSHEESIRVIKLLDKFVKGNENLLSKDEFKNALQEAVPNKADTLKKAFEKKTFLQALEKQDGYQYSRNLEKLLDQEGIPAQMNAYLTRGFDYYTGIIFEVFDTNPANSRSLFGGGRYNDLLDIFGAEKISAVGFGMGDVTIRDVLETYNLLPNRESVTKLLIIPHASEFIDICKKLAAQLRSFGIAVALQLVEKKMGENFKYAERHLIPFAVVIGKNEEISGMLSVKNILTQEQTPMRMDDIAAWIAEQQTRKPVLQ